MGLSEEDQYTRRIAQGRNRLAFLAIVAALCAVFLGREWSERHHLDQVVTSAVNEVENPRGEAGNVNRAMIDPATAAFGGLALGATGLALVCGFAWWLASRKPKIAFGLSALTGLVLILSAAYGFSLAPGGRPPSGPSPSTLSLPRNAPQPVVPSRSTLWTPRQGQAEPRAVVMGSLPALFAGFFLVAFSLSFLRAANALSREQRGAATG